VRDEFAAVPVRRATYLFYLSASAFVAFLVLGFAVDLQVVAVWIDHLDGLRPWSCRGRRGTCRDGRLCNRAHVLCCLVRACVARGHVSSGHRHLAAHCHQHGRFVLLLLARRPLAPRYPGAFDRCCIPGHVMQPANSALKLSAPAVAPLRASACGGAPQLNACALASTGAAPAAAKGRSGSVAMPVPGESTGAPRLVARRRAGATPPRGQRWAQVGRRLYAVLC